MVRSWAGHSACQSASAGSSQFAIGETVGCKCGVYSTDWSQMRPDLAQRLCGRHPRILSSVGPFAGRANSEACLAVEDGWYALLDVLCTDLQSETDQRGAPQIHATEVTQAFGGLRFRVRNPSSRQRAMIQLAESLSGRLCEKCGAPASLFSVAVHEPRCGRHPKRSVKQVAANWSSRWSAFLARFGGRLEDSTPTAVELDAAWSLNEAIRENDIEATKAALGNGGCLHACTLDHEGYHTPRELAQRHGQTEISRLLDVVSAPAKLTRHNDS